MSAISMQISDRIEFVASGSKDFLVDDSRVVRVKSILHSFLYAPISLLTVASFKAVAMEKQDCGEIYHRSETLHVIHCHRAAR